MATRAIDRSTDRFDSIALFGPGPLQSLMWPTGSYASVGSKTNQGFGKPPGDAPPGDTHDRRSTDRPIDRSIDRSIPIDRPIRFNTPLRTWSSTGTDVADKLLRHPREHIKARIREGWCHGKPLELYRGNTHRVHQMVITSDNP